MLMLSNGIKIIRLKLFDKLVFYYFILLVQIHGTTLCSVTFCEQLTFEELFINLCLKFSITFFTN